LSEQAALNGLPAGHVLAVRYALAISPRETHLRATVVVQENGGPAVSLGILAIQPLARSFRMPAMAQPLAVRFGDVAELRGYAISTAAAPRTLQVTLYWQALQPTVTSYTVFTHLVTPSGQLAGQHDGLPADGQWPTTAWLPGQVITDTHALTVANGADIDADTLQIGLYDATTQQRLPATGAADQTGPTYAIIPLRPA
jgi:hypothetical protein